jgi:hypothetical protein
MENKHVQADAKAVKPTLMGRTTVTPIADDEGEIRILSNLKTQPLAKAPRGIEQKSSTLKTLAVLSLAAAAVFFGYQYVSGTANLGLGGVANQSSSAKLAKGQGQNPVIEEKALALSTAAASAAPIASTTPDAAHIAVTTVPEAAQIVNEPGIAKAVPPANSESKLTTALEEGVKPPKATIQRALEAKDTTKAQSAPKAQTAGVIAEKKPSVVAGKDKDINLLAAFVTHNNAPTAVTEVKQPVVAKNNATSTVKITNVGTAPEKPTATPTTSIVQTTESQLKQCSELGFFEREICRMKTCNTLWETNAACKASLSPNAAPGAEVQKTAAQKSGPAAAGEKPSVASSVSNSGATELQLKQCGDLGFFGREACRMRTCTNLWETNAACKATLSPTPTVSADAQKR